MIISFISLSLITLSFYISISGYGKLLIILFNFKNDLFRNIKIVEFFFGLILIGFFAVLYNFFYHLGDYFSYSIILIGLIIYSIFLINNRLEIGELFTIFPVLLIAIFFSFYSISNDDFDYHFKTIIIFKENPIVVDLLHLIDDGNKISFNSHWLIINSVYYLNKYPASVFCITSLLYSLAVCDFFRFYKNSFNTFNKLAVLYSFFIIIFLLGVINYQKEYGTDYPGQIIILIIFLIFFYKSDNLLNKNDHKIFYVMLLLAYFAVSIKLFNILIFILLFFIFLRLNNKIKIIFFSSLLSLPLFFWILQNYLISGCLLWPISITCFDNAAEAKNLFYEIEFFAKSLNHKANPSIDPLSKEQSLELIKNFNWVAIWFKSHFSKILEIYGIYFALLITPYFFLKKNKIRKKLSETKKNESFFNSSLNNPYIIFSLFSLIATMIWFIKSPAYRFAIGYNLNFLIIFLFPMWLKILKNNIKIYYISVRIILIISILFFLYKNINKIESYKERHGLYWPNIIEGKYLN